MKHSPVRALVAALAVAIALVAFGASNASAFSIEGVTATPVAPSRGSPVADDPVLADPAQAGGHPDMQIAINFSDRGRGTADSAESLQIDLAPGVVANVQNADVCAAFTTDNRDETRECEAAIVGLATTNATAYLPAGLDRAPVIGPLVQLLMASLGIRDLPFNLPVPLSGPIYRIDSPDRSRAPTAFGIDVGPPAGLAALIRRVKLVSPITVIPENLGLRASLSGLPDEASGLPVHIDGLVQTLYGYTPSGRSFFTNPTACLPAPIRVSSVSHDGVASEGTAVYNPTNCQNVPFNSRLSIGADPATADSTSAINVNVQPDSTDVPIAGSHVRSTSVVTPPGVLLNSSLAAGLDACTDAQFAQRNTAVEAACPPSSRVGSIDFISPILGRFPGTAYFGTQTATDRLRLFLDIPLYGAHIKVSATVNPDYRTGQITTNFSILPQIAFTSFRLTFNGGSRSALVTPTTCGENVATAVVGPWSGGPASTPSGSFVTTDCNRLFAPGFATGVSTSQAGASPAFDLIAERPDRQVPIGRMAFDLPPGLVGDLDLPGLAQCALADAAAGNCGEASKVGDVVSVVGSGGEPPSLPGQAYLTVPKQAGDIAGLSIKVPARLGPVDAGTVIVGVRLILRNDGSLHVLSDDIPALQLGIPLAIRKLTVSMNRQGFMRNPTSCGTKQATAAFTPLDGGPNSGAVSQFEINGCDRLPFGPRLAASLGARGQTRTGSHPSFTTTITQTAAEASMRKAVVKTPVAMSTDLRTVGLACLPEVLAQNRCAESARVAEATAVSPLISQPLTGPVWLVKRPRGLPSLRVQLRGQASIDLDGIVTTGRGNALITTFDNIPDLTISSFQLRFRGGNGGVFTAVRNLCERTLYTSTQFSGQNGKASSQRSRLEVAGCTASGARTRGSGTLRLRDGAVSAGIAAVAPAGRRLASVKVTLPKGLTIGRSARRLTVAKAGSRRLGARAVRTGRRAVTVRTGRRSNRKVTVNLRGVSVSNRRLARRLSSRRGTVTVTVATRTTDNRRSSIKVKLKVR